MSDYYTEEECQLLEKQVARRYKYRLSFLKQRTDPCKHSQEAGFVFDTAHQRYLSMKVSQDAHFRPNLRTSLSGLLLLVPMVAFGAALYRDRAAREREYRCGIVRYRERLFKLL